MSSDMGHSATRPLALAFAKALLLLYRLQPANAIPLASIFQLPKGDVPNSRGDASLWLYLSVAVVLVLLGGAFAGLTIALMGQDTMYLQVIAASGEGREQNHAQKVYHLLKTGKHWVLVTLLLSNVIVNETLPIVLDRSLGGGWPAVLGSTALIVIFGEIIPQSVCVRYGMQIGAFMAPYVLVLMYLLAPLAYPTAKLLDWLLGEDHGTVYKKSGLKTLVTLHKTLGRSPSERLNQDEVTIISAVLDLKDKPVGDIMTPMEDVFIMSADTVLDEKTMDVILSAGYSRIPIHEPGNDRNFVGMLLVKILITYDPEDCKRVGEFALATLPETRPETSCLDIVNFFQEGKSHMVLVSEYPGEDHGAAGVVTLEDVIEELIGEEIIDESDVYIDVHKAIRRIAPAPKARVGKGHFVSDTDASPLLGDYLTELNDKNTTNDGRQQDKIGSISSRSKSPAIYGSSPKTTILMKKGSADPDGGPGQPIALRSNANDLREHLKYLGPSNLASRPKSTRYNSVKIKPGYPAGSDFMPRQPSFPEIQENDPEHASQPGGENEALLKGTNGEYSGVQTIQHGYGAIDISRLSRNMVKSDHSSKSGILRVSQNRKVSPLRSSARSGGSGECRSDLLRNLPSRESSPTRRRRFPARSGSITESYINAGGVRKVVLETNSSSDDPDSESRNDGMGKSDSSSSTTVHLNDGNGYGAGPLEENMKKKQPRRKRRKKAETKSNDSRGSEF